MLPGYSRLGVVHNAYDRTMLPLKAPLFGTLWPGTMGCDVL